MKPKLTPLVVILIVLTLPTLLLGVLFALMRKGFLAGYNYVNDAYENTGKANGLVAETQQQTPPPEPPITTTFHGLN